MRVDGLLRHPRSMAARPVRGRIPHMQVVVEVRVAGGRKFAQPLPNKRTLSAYSVFIYTVMTYDMIMATCRVMPPSDQE